MVLYAHESASSDVQPMESPLVVPAAGPLFGSFRRRLVLVALVGLALRLAVVLAVPTRPTSDSWSYLQRGTNILRHGRYEALPGLLDATYPPGYPLALAAVMAVAPAAHALGAAKLLSCGLAVAAILLIGHLGRRLFGPTTGLLAAAILAAYPRHVLQSTVLVSEHLFLPLLLLLLTVLAAAWSRPAAWRLAVLAGAATGALALVRPIGYLLGLLWMGRMLTNRRQWRTVLAELTLVLAAQHAVMLPWAIRNHATLGAFSFLSSAGGVDLLIGNNPRATGGWMPWRPVLEELEPAARDTTVGCFTTDKLAREAALRWMRDNPASTLRLYARKLGQILWREDYLLTFSITGTNLWPPLNGASALPAGHPAIAAAPAIQTLLDWSYRVVAALAIVGCVLAARDVLRQRPGVSAAVVVLPVAAAYFPLVAAVFLSSSRFRWPAEELLLVLAAFALIVPATRRQPSNRHGDT